MKKFIHLFILIVSALLPIHIDGASIDYDLFSSIDEVIERETEEIDRCSKNYVEFSDAYLSRGESYLLSGQYECALEDLQKGYEIAGLCPEQEKHVLFVRSLFAQAIVYGNLGLITEVQACASEIHVYLAFLKCDDCRKAPKRERDFSALFFEQPSLVEDFTIQECIERVHHASVLVRALIIKTNAGVQFTLNLLIDSLENEAIRCCKSGGIWDACFKPAVNKWIQLSSKWQLLRIPPDPAWDDD